MQPKRQRMMKLVAARWVRPARCYQVTAVFAAEISEERRDTAKACRAQSLFPLVGPHETPGGRRARRPPDGRAASPSVAPAHALSAAPVVRGSQGVAGAAEVRRIEPAPAGHGPGAWPAADARRPARATRAHRRAAQTNPCEKKARATRRSEAR
jgi:hypothetical protein